MKALFAVLLVVIVWCFVGHFYPVVSISMTFLLLPATLFISKRMFGKSLNGYVYSLFGFGVILLNDFLFRFFGGGLHDDAGRGVCEIIFYATLLLGTISLLTLQFQDVNKVKAKIYGVLFVLTLALITLFIFRTYNVFI